LVDDHFTPPFLPVLVFTGLLKIFPLSRSIRDSPLGNGPDRRPRRPLPFPRYDWRKKFRPCEIQSSSLFPKCFVLFVVSVPLWRCITLISADDAVVTLFSLSLLAGILVSCCCSSPASLFDPPRRRITPFLSSHGRIGFFHQAVSDCLFPLVPPAVFKPCPIGVPHVLFKLP